MEDHECMMTVLEGSCPDCHVNLKYIEYGGTVEFLQEHFLRGIVVTVWMQECDDIGLIVGVCEKCGMRYEAYKSQHDDWNVVESPIGNAHIHGKV